MHIAAKTILNTYKHMEISIERSNSEGIIHENDALDHSETDPHYLYLHI